MEASHPVGITDVVLRDAHQSLLATRLRIGDMLPIAAKLDQVGFWSLESWGGATFDACIRYLGEDPWERIRLLKAAMPRTPQQMLFRGQNILGYRHYADDLVERFVERAALNGVDIFRIFDAMNDMRNLRTAVRAVLKRERHAQGAISYTVSPVHTLEMWVDCAKQIEDMGAHSVCIKDMAGLLRPYDAFELVSRLKEALEIPVHIHCHATTGMSTSTYLKAIEAGVDNVDTAISSMSMTYGHSATETLVAVLEGSDRATGLDLPLLEEIAAYFRDVRKKYANYEGGLRGVDSRILVAQVPGGMLTNLEIQLREQGASDRLDEVLEEIPHVREDLGYLPLVTPTSQIVGTQAVLNVLAGERYKNVTQEIKSLLKGEYGATPAAVNAKLQASVLQGARVIDVRPADLLEPEVDALTQELRSRADEKGISLSEENLIDDVLTYALFPQRGLYFLQHRGDPNAFEPTPDVDARKMDTVSAGDVGQPLPDTYTVTVEGRTFVVEVAEGDRISAMSEVAPGTVHGAVPGSQRVNGATVAAALAGNVLKVVTPNGAGVQEGDVVLVVEAMKMETEVTAPSSGVVSRLHVAEGDSVTVGQPLFDLV